jgi:5-methylcytosine-specific restriction endonuclease McrA
MCDQEACKRIRAARVARQFPAVFPLLADGRLHVSGILTLKPLLTPENAGELLAAAAGKTRSEIEAMLVARFPRPDLPTVIAPVVAKTERIHSTQLSPGTVGAPAPESDEVPTPRARVIPLSAESVGLQTTLPRSTHERLRYLRALLGHQIPSGSIPAVLDRAFDLAIGVLEKQKFAACRRSRSGQRRASANPRHIPAAVKHAVWERDGGRCTFVGENGQRCPAESRLEFDHIEAVARGGTSTVDNLRLRCRAHNQYEAERTYGTEFMNGKREAARRARAEARGPAKAARPAPDPEWKLDVLSGLRNLGCKVQDARAAAALCDSLAADATLEQRMRVALTYFVRPDQRRAGGIMAMGT